MGRSISLPKPRYVQPVVMNSENYHWVTDRDNAGIHRQHLGTFNEHRTGVGHLKMLPGSSIPGGVQEDAEIRYLLEGSVTYGGKTWGKDTFFFLPFQAQREELRSGKGATFFIIDVPMVGDVVLNRAQRPQVAEAV
jgi:hypothetical protein